MRPARIPSLSWSRRDFIQDEISGPSLDAISQAFPKPEMRSTFSVPALLPPSWPPPCKKFGKAVTLSSMKRAPMPLGAPSLWLKKGRSSQIKLTRLHDGENEARTEGLWVHRSGAEKGGEELR